MDEVNINTNLDEVNSNTNTNSNSSSSSDTTNDTAINNNTTGQPQQLSALINACINRNFDEIKKLVTDGVS